MSSSKKRRLRLVLDTSVWVSAVIWGGLPAKIVKNVEEGKIIILLSEKILSEISRILNYGKLRRIYAEAGLNRGEIIATITQISKIVEVTRKLNVVQEDPSDNKFIECAMDGQADYIVTGNKHLLRIKHYGKVEILSVKEFVKSVRG